MAYDYETLLVEKRGHVAWLYFNRPDQLNAFNVQMTDDLNDAWKELDADDDVRVIVNTGKGRAFQTGVDVKEVSEAGGMAGRGAGRERKEGGFTARTNNIWKPVIAAVNGMCVGGGFHFVADADIVLASTAAWFMDSHVSVGQVTALEPISLIGRMPFEALMRMVLIGRHERITPQRAYELGLVSQVIEAESFEDEVQALAEKVASNSPSTMMLSKKAVWHGLEMGREQALAYGLKAVQYLWDHPDNVEGARAFAERREPDWAPPRRPRI
jgi:enoyl-CoA hydratase/carnithine racemase